MAASARRRVMIPFKVSATSVAEYERRFGWKIVVENHGLRSAHAPHVAGLAYCMALRNMLALGADGEEVIAIDADLPLVVAKGAAYVKVVRTATSNRLVSGYALEEMQLERLARSGNSSVKTAAAATLDDLRAGGGGRVFLNPCDVAIRGDAVLVDHTRTSISLAQVVACASAWRATVVRGVCFFQVEMLTEKSGALSAFPGSYFIDEDEDVITYVPDVDPETSFSHCWSALRSFFVNHECVYEGKTWVVEKHLGEGGIFHYVANCAREPWEFPVELGANYYSEDMTEWVELEFPTRGGVADGASAVYWRREKVRLLKSLYEKTMATLLSVDPKRLTREEVLGVMRAFNNTTVVGGDTVKRPLRVYAGDLDKAATPVLAQVVHRRAAASAECSKALGEIRRRYNIANEGVLSLFWEMCCSTTSFVKDVSIAVAFGNETRELTDLVSGSVNMAVLAKEVPASILVVQVVGGGVQRDCGPMLPGLPGSKPSFVVELLERARRFASEGTAMFRGSCVPFGPGSSSGSEGGVSVDSSLESAEGYSGRVTGLPTLVCERESYVPVSSVEREGITKKLYDKLVAEQDAVDFVKPPRVVTSYEQVSALRSTVVPTTFYGVSAMQEDYDDGFPGVSMSDPEVVPYVASVEDTSVVREAYMSINDAKREAAQPRYVRRAKGRAAAAGVLPRTQMGLLAALGKRNTDVPVNRASVDFELEPKQAVSAIRDVCYVDEWKAVLERELNTGLWQPCKEDLNVYVGKVETSKAEAMLKEFFSIADVDMHRWLVMTKGKCKPPLDPGADAKVPLPQTIMYNESKGMNAMYSSIMSRFHDVVDAMMLPSVKFNDRSSPAEHEIWFNTLQPLRATAPVVHRYQGDSFNFDRSQELMAFSVELQFYKEHGLDEQTLDIWKQTMGVKTAVSLMHGILMHIVLQGLSGIFKTLFRNGLVTLASVIVATRVTRQTLISLDIKGDDYTLETNVPVDVAYAVRVLAWKFNFSAKLWGCDYLYFCSKYWVWCDGWWYWVTDPERKFEALCAAVAVNDKGETVLSEKWTSLREDLRHYDNGAVVEELANAVLATNTRRLRPPVMLIGGLANLAENRDEFFSFYGPTELVGV